MIALLFVATINCAHAATRTPEIRCHYTYGGETKTHIARPTIQPLEVQAIEIGSYFLFRAVLITQPRDEAGIHLYTYASKDDAPVILHEASYAWPPRNQSRYGFTGHQRVYEPVRDGELEYWCEVK